MFKTPPTPETILHGYEEYGKEILQKLQGHVRLCHLGQGEEGAFRRRDIFGIKPFYYYKNGDQFFVGSEIKSFLSHPCFVKELDEEKIPEYLSYEYIPYESTIFKKTCTSCRGPTASPPGRQADGGAVLPASSTRLRRTSPWRTGRRQIQKEFEESVAMHQIADVEVGCFLSSGVDSSYVVNEISKGTEKVKTFSVGYTEEKYSELPYAQKFSQTIGVENISNKVSADEFFDAVPEIQYMLDEPPLPNPRRSRSFS